MAFDAVLRKASISSESSALDTDMRIRQENLTEKNLSAQFHACHVTNRVRLRYKMTKTDQDKITEANFKAELLLIGLQEQKQNARLFRSFTTTFCVTNSLPSPPSLIQLPLFKSELTVKIDKVVLNHPESSGHNLDTKDRPEGTTNRVAVTKGNI